MADRPILFSAPMVRALLAGTKTQTRRTIKPQPTAFQDIGLVLAENPLRIAVGDRLWVREAWRTVKQHDHIPPRELHPGWTIQYLAQWPLTASIPSGVDEGPALTGKDRVSIHMPRWASRLTLTVTDVRVQRLQDISEEDAKAEGCNPGGYLDDGVYGESYWAGYANLWQAINGPGSWDENPWVAAYTFTVERVNIDQARAA